MEPPIQVLHVDDTADFAEMVALFLPREDERIGVHTATSAEEGLEMVSEREIDCIVSDYDMPGYDGLEFFELVQEEHAEIPFILYTGKGSEEIASEAISVGVTDYLQKGSGTEQYTILANRIRNAVNQTRSEKAVERTREYFSTILDQASDYVMIVGEDGEVDYISPAVERVLGYSPEELAESDAFEYTHPDDQATAAAAFIELFEHPDEENTVEFRARHADGSWQWLEVRGRNLLDDPIIDGVMVNVRDITDRKERERELAQLKERYQAFVEDSSDIITVVDSEGAIVYESPSVERILGYDPEERVGANVFEFMHPDDRPMVRDRISEITAEDDRETGRVEYRIERNDGTWVWMESVGTDRTASVIEGYVVTSRDITERKERERELERQGLLFRRVQDIADIGVWEFDPQIEVLTWSDGIRRIHGVDDDFEPTLEAALEWYHPEDREEITGLLTRAIEDGTDFDTELRLVRPDGTVREVRAYGEVQTDEKGNPEVLRGVFQDITERKERENKLQRYEYAYESSLSAIVIASLDGEVLDVNPAFLDMWGHEDSDDVLGDPVTAFWNHPENAQSALDTVKEQGNWEGELEAVRTDGSTFYARGAASPLTDGDGDPIGVMASFVDDTERVDHERELRRQNQRLDEFASVLSHDLRNPLNVAQGRLELASEACDSEHFEPVERAHRRMESLIEDLLTLARNGKAVTDREPVDVSSIVNGCWATVDTKDATIAIEIDRTIQADESRLQQVFENLFRNAVEHGGEDVTVTVGELDDGFYVEDDGPGIPAADREQIFEAGYSTSTEGTGFGLSIVKEIVEAHDWDIRLRDGTDGGARFEITGIGAAVE